MNDRENEDWRTYLRAKKYPAMNGYKTMNLFRMGYGKQMNGIKQQQKNENDKIGNENAMENTKTDAFTTLFVCAFFFKYFSFKIAACISFRRLSCLRLGDAQTRGEWPMACTMK